MISTINKCANISSTAVHRIQHRTTTMTRHLDVGQWHSSGMLIFIFFGGDLTTLLETNTWLIHIAGVQLEAKALLP